MKRYVLFAGIFIAGLLIAGIAYVLRPPVEASAPIEAVPLAAATETSVPELTPSAQAETVVEEPPVEIATEPAVSPGIILYTISQQESEVRFLIDELLRNVPTTAIGSTNQIAGEIAIDFTDPASSQVGQITVNARTLATDNNNRNRMIRNEILDTAEYEFVVFTPDGLSGMPETIVPGETVVFQISGDLTIRDVSAPETFDVSASVDETGRLSGTASTVVLRSVYGLVIPSVPNVADVSDEVILEFDFVANPK